MSKELIDRLRVFAGDPVLGSVADEAASQLTIEGASCGNCRYRPAMTCMLKSKVVKFYNICAEWKECEFNEASGSQRA